jgi:hypothetical protein
MTRALYGGLVRLHPAAFRSRFGAEMLLNFDEAAASEGTARLLLDALASLLRQWLLRSGAWKLGPALLGALLQAIFLGLFYRWQHGVHFPRPVAIHGGVPASPLMLLMIYAASSIVIVVGLTALWVRAFVFKTAGVRPERRRAAA